MLMSCLIHVFDVISDVYLLYLWWSEGRTLFFYIGLTFCVITFLLSTVALTRVLEPRHAVSEGRPVSKWPFVFAAFNMHSLYFATRVWNAQPAQKAGYYTTCVQSKTT